MDLIITAQVIDRLPLPCEIAREGQCSERVMSAANKGPSVRPRADELGWIERFWRNRAFARIRHRLTGLRRSSPATTRLHAALIRLSGGRIRRSFLFTGGMPVLVLTTTGRRSGQRRSTPVGYLKHGEAFAVLASNAGNDRSPAWWLNLQADPSAEVLAERPGSPSPRDERMPPPRKSCGANSRDSIPASTSTAT
jgi:F420H(2)-dependent quinone reductase